MRVIAGTAKGMRLAAPKGLDVRPTLDRVRESLFNILAPRIEGAAFLDLFAGTGANGIEALSRGARNSVFVDNDSRSLETIRLNIEKTRLSASAEVYRLTLPEDLSRLGDLELQYDIIFADPPYVFREYSSLLGAVQTYRLLAADGLIVIEHAARSPLPERIAGFERFRSTKYGDTALSFFA